MDWPKLKRDHAGLIVKTVSPLRNGFMEIPAGTVCKVRNAHGGLDLQTEPCEKCGVSVFIRKVGYSSVVLISGKQDMP